MYLHCKCINVAVLSSCVRPKVLDDKDLYRIVAKQLSIMVYRAGCSIGDSTKHSFPIISHQITSTTPTRTYPPHHRPKSDNHHNHQALYHLSHPPVNTPAWTTQATGVASNMIGASSSYPKIGMLHDGNWLAWKMRIAAVLKRNGAYEIVTGLAAQPQDPVAAAEWKMKDAIAQELVVTTIKDEQVLHIIECETSAQMWEALRIIHEPRGQYYIFLTKRALYTAQASEDTDIPSHLNYMRLLRQRLTLAGHPIDDTEFKAILAASLPRSWGAFTMSYLGY